MDALIVFAVVAAMVDCGYFKAPLLDR